MLIRIIAEVVEPFLKLLHVLAGIAVFEHVFLCGGRIHELKQLLVNYARLSQIMGALKELYRFRNGRVIHVAGLIGRHIVKLHEPRFDPYDLIVLIPHVDRDALRQYPAAGVGFGRLGAISFGGRGGNRRLLTTLRQTVFEYRGQHKKRDEYCRDKRYHRYSQPAKRGRSCSVSSGHCIETAFLLLLSNYN